MMALHLLFASACATLAPAPAPPVNLAMVRSDNVKWVYGATALGRTVLAVGHSRIPSFNNIAELDPTDLKMIPKSAFKVGTRCTGAVANPSYAEMYVACSVFNRVAGITDVWTLYRSGIVGGRLGKLTVVETLKNRYTEFSSTVYKDMAIMLYIGEADTTNKINVPCRLVVARNGTLSPLFESETEFDSMAVGGDVLYLTQRNELYSVDLTTPFGEWRLQGVAVVNPVLTFSGSSKITAAAPGVVFMVSSDGLMIVDGATGERLNTVPHVPEHQVMLLHAGILYLDVNDTLKGINVNDPKNPYVQFTAPIKYFYLLTITDGKLWATTQEGVAAFALPVTGAPTPSPTMVPTTAEPALPVPSGNRNPSPGASSSSSSSGSGSSVSVPVWTLVLFSTVVTAVALVAVVYAVMLRKRATEGSDRTVGLLNSEMLSVNVEE